jgi:hypothetical protein
MSMERGLGGEELLFTFPSYATRSFACSMYSSD